MKTKKKEFRWRGHTIFLSFLIGCTILGIVLTSSIHTDMQIVENDFSDTLNYIKKQCASYTSLALASEAKSLMRVMECAQLVSQALEGDDSSQKEEILPETLAELADDLYLTGILLLDEDGTVVSEYSRIQADREDLREVCAKKTLLEVADYPEKTYSTRIECEDDSYLDLAAVKRKDAPGLLVAYYYTDGWNVHSYSLSFHNLLSGYSIERDGTIVMTRENQIVASNDASLEGKSIAEVPALYNINRKAKKGILVQVPVKEGGFAHMFGMFDRGRDYYVYAFRPERAVFAATPRRVGMTVLAYILTLSIISVIRWKLEKRYTEAQRENEQVYQEQLKEAARRAESANVAKTEFLQRMSHDIRTPINGIRGMIEMANYYSEDLDKQKECRKKIWEASGFLLELVNEVLDMGKLESGQVVLESRPFDVRSVIDDVKNVVEKQAVAREIQIFCETSDLKHPYVIGSPLHVKRLLMNILGNAVKYNRERGKVYISCREVQYKEDTDTVWMEFTCADTGIGMSEEFQKHLFEPFMQEEESARSTYGGTGLGMAISKSLIDKMGGTIEFESRKNVGTTYHIRLPFQRDPKGTEKTETQETEETKPLAGIHVLLAEDNHLNMEIAEFILENEGMKVTKVQNGQEAVEVFQASAPGTFDAILMDVMMPVMDGHEAARQIRALKRKDAATIPIIAMTANAFAEDRQKAKEAGMNEHLTKPLEVNKLKKTLAYYCLNGRSL